MTSDRTARPRCLPGRRPALVDGRGWAVVLDDPESIREAERRYAERYKVPRKNPD